MTALQSSTGKALLQALKKAGFEVLRVHGSHHLVVAEHFRLSGHEN